MNPRPAFSKAQIGILVIWAVAWGVVVFVWWADNASGGGWVGSGFVAFIALFAFGVGLGALAILAALVRVLIAGDRSRYVLLVGVPFIAAAWLFGVYWEQADHRPDNSYPTGLVVEHMPEGFGYASEDWFHQRGTYNVFRSYSRPGELAIGVLDPDTPPPEGRNIRRDGCSNTIAVDDEYTRVTRKIDGVYVEVVSDELPAETLIAIAESTRYHSEWDVWGVWD